MQTVNQAIVYTLRVSHAYLKMMTQDLTQVEMLHRFTPTANCIAWILGHLILSERGVLGKSAADIPLPAGFEDRFPRKYAGEIDFGDVSVLLPLYDRHRERLIEVAESMTPEQMDQPIESPVPFVKTFGEAVHFMAVHSTSHAGQISMIRRSLGKPPVI